MDLGWAGTRTDDGGYIVAGMTSSYGVGIDAYLVKTDANGVIGIQEPPHPVVRSTALRCEPNPFKTAINLRPAADGPSRISIHDAAGRCVRVMPVGGEPPAVSVWDGTDDTGRPLPPGVYVVRAGRRTAAVTKL